MWSASSREQRPSFEIVRELLSSQVWLSRQLASLSLEQNVPRDIGCQSATFWGWGLGDAGTAPFLKWAGGKRWFVQRYGHLLPSNFERYVEPFLGSGAVFFSLR